MNPCSHTKDSASITRNYMYLFSFNGRDKTANIFVYRQLSSCFPLHVCNIWSTELLIWKDNLVYYGVFSFCVMTIWPKEESKSPNFGGNRSFFKFHIVKSLLPGKPSQRNRLSGIDDKPKSLFVVFYK